LTARAVLDASAAVHLVMNGEHASWLAAKLEEAALVTAPDLFCSEVASALCKYVRAKDLTLDAAILRYDECTHLVDSLIPGRTGTVEALSAAARHRHSVYDMMYAVLARRSSALVITMDRSFALTLREMEIETCCPRLAAG
jgi:predicted nucleic acid-binding protein